MLFQEAWKRFWLHFGSLWVVGFVVNLVWAVPVFGLWVAVMVRMMTPMFAALWQGEQPNPADFLDMTGWMLGLLGIIYSVMILVMPFVVSAQLHAVHDVMQEQKPTVARAFRGGARLWLRSLGYMLLMGVCMLGTTVPFIIASVLTFGLAVPLYLFAVLLLVVAAFNGLYSMVAEDLTIMGAFSRAWQRLFRNFGEHAAAAGILVVMYVALVVAMFIMIVVPIIGWLALLGSIFVFGPVMYLFVMLYLAVRYHASMEPPEPPAYGE